MNHLIAVGLSVFLTTLALPASCEEIPSVTGVPVLGRLNEEIQKLRETVSPSVVTLWAADLGQRSLDDFGIPASPDLTPGTKLAPMFIEVSDEDGSGKARTRKARVIGNGTGFVISPNGIIGTNAHVALIAAPGKGRLLLAQFKDGRMFPARILAADAAHDMALVKIDAPAPLPAAKLGDSDSLEVGESVFAMGTPSHSPFNFTWGTVNSVHGFPGRDPKQLYLHIDAVINPGNSGGPLFNARGEVVGINSMLFNNSGLADFTGNGLAIRINDFKDFVARAIASAGRRHEHE